MPEFKNPDAGRLDLISAAMSILAVLAVIYGLKQIAQDGIGPNSVLPILAGLGAAWLFVRRERSSTDPLIDFQLFRSAVFTTGLAINVLDFFIGFGINLFIAQYLQSVLGLSPIKAGLWTVPWALGYIVGSMLTPVFVCRVRTAFVMAAGLAVAAVGFGVLTQLEVASGLRILVIGSVLLSIGLAPTTTLATDILVSMAPPERAGTVSSVSETSSELGGALGIAILGIIGTAVYRSYVAAAIPAAVPVAAAHAALSTLGGASAVAGQLPDLLRIAVLRIARDAFTQGFALVSGVSSAIAAGTAIVAAVRLRYVGQSKIDESSSHGIAAED